MSKCNWFWENYQYVMNWNKRHEIVYWKSQAAALKSENQILLRALHNNSCNLVAKNNAAHFSSSCNLIRANKRKPRKRQKLTQNSKLQKSVFLDSDVEVTPELFEFFKISLEHKKMNLKGNFPESLSEFLPPQKLMEERQKEMKDLYGDGSAKILGMETALTLAFNRYVDQKNPEYWPTIPLNFKS